MYGYNSLKSVQVGNFLINLFESFLVLFVLMGTISSLLPLFLILIAVITGYLCARTLLMDGGKKFSLFLKVCVGKQQLLKNSDNDSDRGHFKQTSANSLPWDGMAVVFYICSIRLLPIYFSLLVTYPYWGPLPNEILFGQNFLYPSR